MTITTSELTKGSGSGYTAYNAERTTNAISTTDPNKTYPVTWTSYQVMVQTSYIQWQKNAGKIYNSTDLGAISEVIITSSTTNLTTYYGTQQQPTSNTTVGGGYFQISNGNATTSITKIEITFTITESDPSDQSVATTTVINVPENFNTDVNANEVAGTLTATVTTESGNVEGADVTWTSTVPSVATIDENTGSVTLIEAGSTTITATYAGVSGQYKASNATYVLTVTDSSILPIWSENFSSYSANDVPSGGTYYYSCSNGTDNGTTQIYNQNTAGGTAPELLVAKSNGTFSTTISDLQNCQGNPATLSFITNNTSLTATITTNSGSIVNTTGSVNNKQISTLSFTIPAAATSLTITFTTTNSSNARLDDIVLKGKPNDVSSTQVSTPTFSVTEGTYTAAQSVELTCATEGATIYYTIDGSEPTTNSTQYTGAISVNNTTTIKAIAVAEGMDNSTVASATYTIDLTPSIVFDGIASPTHSTDYAAGNTNIHYVVANLTGTLSVVLCDANGNATTYDWFTATLNSENYVQISWTENTNTESPRTACFKLTDGSTTSTIFTVTQAEYEIDYATLPFNWEGGSSTALLQEDGITAYSLGSDYAIEYDPYYVKFDSNGDYIQIKTDSKPGVVTIGVKMIGGATSSTITIQESTDGTNFTNVQALTISGSQNDILSLTSTAEFTDASRYVRLLFTKGSNVGVGPISITKGALKGTAENPYSVAQARTLMDSNSPDQNNIHVRGIVCEVGNLVNGQLSYYISDNGTNNNRIYIHIGKYLNDAVFTSDNLLRVGDQVTVNGNFSKYNNAYDCAGGSIITSFTAAQYFTITRSTTNCEVYVFDDPEGSNLEFENSINLLGGKTIYLSPSAIEGYSTPSVTVTDADNQEVALTDAGEGMLSFVLNSDVTITATATQIVTYQLADRIVSGKHYLIASGTDGAIKAMGAQNNNNRTAVAVTASNYNIVITDEAVAEVVIYGPDANGFYSIYDETEGNSGYLYAPSSSSNYMKLQQTNDMNGRWSISFNEETNVASIVAQGSNTRNTMQFNSSSSLFNCYGSASQAAVYLYVKADDVAAPLPTKTVTLNSNGYATYASNDVLDFLDATDTDGASNKNYSAWVITSVEDNVITFSQVKEQTIGAGTGILLKGTAGATVEINTARGTGANIDNLLFGTSVPTAISAGQYYGLSGNTFVKVNAGTVPAGKALLPANLVNESTGGNVKAFTFVFNDLTTGVNAVDNGRWTMDNGAIFDLSGRRLSKPAKGINIINGKKVVVK